MSTEAIIAIVAILTCVGTSFMVVFKGGTQVGRVEAAIGRLTTIEEQLKRIPELVNDVGILKSTYERMRSDHRALSQKVDKSLEVTAVMRGKLESQHNE